MPYKFYLVDSESWTHKLAAGQVLLWNEKSKTIKLYEKTNMANVLYWPNDPEKLVPFIRSKEDFYLFAEILATTHRWC